VIGIFLHLLPKSLGCDRMKIRVFSKYRDVVSLFSIIQFDFRKPL
jgi:hypothetical protein